MHLRYLLDIVAQQYMILWYTWDFCPCVGVADKEQFWRPLASITGDNPIKDHQPRKRSKLKIQSLVPTATCSIFKASKCSKVLRETFASQGPSICHFTVEAFCVKTDFWKQLLFDVWRDVRKFLKQELDRFTLLLSV